MGATRQSTSPETQSLRDGATAIILFKSLFGWVAKQHQSSFPSRLALEVKPFVLNDGAPVRWGSQEMGLWGLPGWSRAGVQMTRACQILFPDSVSPSAQGHGDLPRAVVRMGNTENKAPYVSKHHPPLSFNFSAIH